MTRLELLSLVVARARSNGLEFRRWYTSRLGLPWISTEAAVSLLDQQRRYYALVFSHEFAVSFWKAGADIKFIVPEQTYLRRMPDGHLASVTRKKFLRRSSRTNAWQYHLREMAAADEPLRYLRRYLNIEDDLDEETGISSSLPKAELPVTRMPSPHRIAHPIPTGLPDFLRRPYPYVKAS